MNAFFFSLLTLCLFVSPAWGQHTSAKPQNGSSISTEISFDYDTAVPKQLSFNVQSDRKKYWLGVSLYPAKFTDALKEGEHFQIEINEQRTSRAVKVGPRFRGGSFEAALWGKKVMKADCTIPSCYWCAKNGFHLDEMLFYKSGSLVYTH